MMVETRHLILDNDRLRAENARLDSIVVSYALTERELKSKLDGLRAALEAMLDEFGEFAMPSVRRARAALEETK